MKKQSYLEKPVRELPRNLPTMNDRIEHIRCTLGYPVNTFAIKVGSSKAVMLKVLKGNVMPHLKILLNILEIFPVHEEWLYLGTGDAWRVDDISEYIFEASNKHKDDIDIQVNERMKEIRLDQNMSQPIFAAAVGATKDMVAFIETGRTALSVPLIKRIIKKYNVSEQWMLWGIGNKYKTKKT